MQTLVLLLLASAFCAINGAPDATNERRCLCAVDGRDSSAWLDFQRERLRTVDAVQLVRIRDVGWEDSIQIATGTVLRSWKGPGEPEIRIATGATKSSQVLTVPACALSLVRGDEYVLFATRRPDGLFTAHQCSGSVRRANAGALLRILEQPAFRVPEA